MLVVRTSECHADPSCQLVGTEHSIALHHLSFAVWPLGLYRVEPRASSREQTGQDAHSATTVLDFPVVGGDPAVRSTLPIGTRAFGGPGTPSGFRISVPTTSARTARTTIGRRDPTAREIMARLGHRFRTGAERYQQARPVARRLP